MSIKPQRCTTCKLEGHNKRNCPGPVNNTDNIVDCDYILNNQEKYDSEDKNNHYDTIKLIERKLLKKLVRDGLRNQGESYFFDNVQISVNEILSNKDKLTIIVFAQPGSGKTMVMDAVAYYKKINPEPIIGDRFTVMTGMSDTLCKDALNDGLPFIKEFIQENENNIGPMIVHHNPMIYKRFEELKKKPILLYNHTFLIDECHIACQEENTIDKQFKSLGITREVVKKLKIQYILVSATPDRIKKECDNAKEGECAVVYMKPGPNYRGFKYFKNKICKYQSLEKKINRDNLINIIKEKYNSPRYHFIRIKPGKFDAKLKLELENQGWVVEDYNMNSKKYFNLDQIIKNEPRCHTFFFIKDMLRQSKRLRLNKYIGIIIEPFIKTDVTITAQGLLARWWAYYTNTQLEECDPLFFCDYSAVCIYLEWIANDLNYLTVKYTSSGMQKRNFKTHQTGIIENDPTKKVFEDSDKCDQCTLENLEDLKIEMCKILSVTHIPSNNGIGSTHENTKSIWISTKYCKKINKDLDDINYDNYEPVTENMLNESRTLGRCLYLNGTKLIFIPFYTNLDNKLMWCCRYFKPIYLLSYQEGLYHH